MNEAKLAAINAALAEIRDANATVESMIQNVFILSGGERYSLLAKVRVDLSSAAAKLSVLVDNEGATGTSQNDRNGR